MIVYIDDILPMGDSPNQMESHLKVLIFILTNLGFIINVPKSVTTSTQIIEFLGLLVNSTSLHLSLPGEKLYHIRMEVKQLLQKEQVTAHQLAQIIGKLIVASQAVLPAPLFYRSLQGDLQRGLSNNNQSYNAPLSLSPLAKEELSWWQEMLGRWNGKALLHQQESAIIRSDASLQGWGGSMQQYQDRRSLESVRTTASHKLPGVACSNSGSKMVSEGSRRIISFTTAGQSDSCGLHQRHEGNCVAPVDRSSQSLVVMGSFQGHCPVCRTYPRDNELHCRHGVQNFERSNRLDATPSDIRSNKL